MRLVIMLITVMVFASCGNKNMLDHQKMQAVMVDMIRAEAYTANHYSTDSNLNRDLENASMQKAIFAKHNITRKQFLESLNKYENDVPKFSVLMDSVNNYLQSHTLTPANISQMPLDTLKPVLDTNNAFIKRRKALKMIN